MFKHLLHFLTFCLLLLPPKADAQFVSGPCCEPTDYTIDVVEQSSCTYTFTLRRNNYSVCQFYNLEWHFGDGTPQVVGSGASITHTFASSGPFIVSAIFNPLVLDPTCQQQLIMATTVNAIGCGGPACTCDIITPAVTITEPMDCNDPHTFEAAAILNCNGPLTVSWNFGDGTITPSSTNLTASHTFATPGTYDVCATYEAADPNSPNTCSATITHCETVVVEACATCPCDIPAFQIVEEHTLADCNSIFSLITNTPDGCDFQGNAAWNFGDGTTATFGIGETVTHDFPDDGSYQVCVTLEAANADGSSIDQSTQCLTVNVTNCTEPEVCETPTFQIIEERTLDDCNAIFSLFIDNNAALNFDGDAVWDFGDGTTGTFASNTTVSHSYSGNGTYRVCATLSGSNADNSTSFTLTKCIDVVISNCNTCNCSIPAFQIMEEHTLPGCNKIFRLAAAAPTGCTAEPNVLWNFGDGTAPLLTSDNFVNHEYGGNGTYMVCATVYAMGADSTCVDTLTECLTVTVTNCISVCDGEIVDYELVINNGNGCDVAMKVQLFNVIGNCTLNDTTFWDFGDGSTGISTGTSGLVASSILHQYATDGTYTACATVYLDDPNTGHIDSLEKCFTFDVTGCTPCVCDINDFDITTNAIDGCGVKFAAFNFDIAGSCEVNDTIMWNFGDGTTGMSTDATGVASITVHHYATNGMYTVCATAKAGFGSCADDTTICVTVIVDHCDGDACMCDLVDYDFNLIDITSCTGTFSTSNYNINGTCDIGPEAVWNFGDGTIQSIPYQANDIVTHTYTSPGTYDVCVSLAATSADGACSDQLMKCIVVKVRGLCDAGGGSPGGPGGLDLFKSESNAVEGTPALEATSDLKIFPNPTSDQLTVLYASPVDVPVQIQVRDVQGKVLINTTQVNVPEGIKIDVSALARGNYLLEIVSQEEGKLVQRFAKQ